MNLLRASVSPPYNKNMLLFSVVVGNFPLALLPHPCREVALAEPPVPHPSEIPACLFHDSKSLWDHEHESSIAKRKCLIASKLGCSIGDLGEAAKDGA